MDLGGTGQHVSLHRDLDERGDVDSAPSRKCAPKPLLETEPSDVHLDISRLRSARRISLLDTGPHENPISSQLIRVRWLCGVGELCSFL